MRADTRIRTRARTHICSGSSPCRYVRFAKLVRAVIDIYLFVPFYTEEEKEVYNCIVPRGHRNVGTSSSAFLRCQWPSPTSRFPAFPPSRRKRAMSEALFTKSKNWTRKNILHNVGFFFFFHMKKRPVRSMVPERTVDAIRHSFVHDENKREGVLPFFLLQNKYYLEVSFLQDFYFRWNYFHVGSSIADEYNET